MEKLADHYVQLTGVNSAELRHYSSYHDLLLDPDIQAVAITVPSGLHGPIAIEALEHGKHVIVEKPIALSIKDARAMVKLSEQSGKKLAVCHQKRFNGHLRYIEQMIRVGGLGNLVLGEMALFYNRNDAYYTSANWRGTWRLDGGMLLNQAIHNIDLLLWLMGGEPESVSGQISRIMRPIETEDSAVATMKFMKGSLANLAATVCASPQSTAEAITLHGDRGRVKLSGKSLEPVEWMVPGWERPELKHVDAYQRLYEDFYASIRDNRSPWVSGKDGLTALETILAMYQSAKVHATIHLPIAEFSTAHMIGTVL